MSVVRNQPYLRLVLGAACLFSALSTACLDERVVDCADGRICPSGLACDDVHQGCVLPQQIDSCAGEPEGTDCSYRGVPRGACYEGVCLPAGCGNGILDKGEACDDGNRFHGDGCSADCRSTEACGNGVVDITLGESCEPSGAEDVWCRADCVTVRCGDGVPDPDAFEACDDGPRNSNEPDAKCRFNCQPRRCGDHVIDSGEVCDDGNARSGDGCAADCLSKETCGNGIVDAVVGESCEPDETNVGWCRPNCVNVRCGDHMVDKSSEQCDDGADNSAAPDAACRPNCLERRCGDKIQDSDEACDDGNQADADGCSHDCKSREICGNGYADLRVGEQCDDGNFLSHDGCTSGCQREAPAWLNLGSGSAPAQANLPYDAMRDTVMLPAWAKGYELHGNAWRSVHSAHIPTGTYLFYMAWDAARRRVVMFGGSDGNGLSIAETWEWDGRDWLRQFPASESPGKRQFHQIVYDPIRQRTIVFGGREDGSDETSWYHDTWEWDGQAWHEIAATGGPPNGIYGATFDPVAGRVVAFNGQDFWYLEGSVWRSVPAPLTAERIGQHSLVYDLGAARLFDFFPGDGKVIWEDGVPRVEPVAPALFEWDGSTWRPRSLPPVPDPRPGAGALVYRTARRRLSLLSEDKLWEWDGNSWLAAASYQGAPSQRSGNRMVYDPLHGTTLLFGGSLWIDGVLNRYPETWIWDGSTWSQRSPRTVPAARDNHAMVYDPVAQRVLMFGGYGSEDAPLDDTWTWDGDDWTELAPASSPPARSGQSMTYDAARKQVVLFGGNEGSDLWSWDGQTWTAHPVDEAPHTRSGQGLSYDPIRRQVLLFGGTANGDLEMYNDVPTLAWDGTSWHKLDVPGLSWRADMAALYDPQRRMTLLVSGVITDNVHTWSLPALPASSASLPWEALPIPFAYDPVLNGNNAVYDALHGRVVAYSDRDVPTWELSYRAETGLDEVCQYGFDVDGDGLIGCADPDCWGYCTPLCPPGIECDEAQPHCGDGTCNTFLETCRMCPQDCGACAPLCGDFHCDPGESSASCPGDCTRAEQHAEP